MAGGTRPPNENTAPPPPRPHAKSKHSGRSNEKVWRIIRQFSPKYSTKLRQASFSFFFFGLHSNLGKNRTRKQNPIFF